jgi:hypothetical protein
MHESLQGQTQPSLAQQHNDGHQQRERQTDRQQIIHRKGLLVTEGGWDGKVERVGTVSDHGLESARLWEQRHVARGLNTVPIENQVFGIRFR